MENPVYQLSLPPARLVASKASQSLEITTNECFLFGGRPALQLAFATESENPIFERF